MAGKILFFGKLADVFSSERPFPADAQTPVSLTELIDLLCHHPDQNKLLTEEGVRVAVDQELIPIGSNPDLNETEEIAFLPPMSGG